MTHGVVCSLRYTGRVAKCADKSRYDLNLTSTVHRSTVRRCSSRRVSEASSSVNRLLDHLVSEGEQFSAAARRRWAFGLPVIE
jgi:hypothetical protein